MLGRLKTFIPPARLIIVSTGSKQERDRERERDKDKGAANSFPTVYRDNFFANFSDKYTSFGKKGSCFRTFEWKPATIAKIRYEFPMATNPFFQRGAPFPDI